MAARTAVVAGTASAVSGRVRQHQENKQEEKYEDQQQAAAPPQAAPVAAAPAPAASDGPSVVDQIKQFAELKDQGILTEEEFAAKKAELLGI